MRFRFTCVPLHRRQPDVPTINAKFIVHRLTQKAIKSALFWLILISY